MANLEYQPLLELDQKFHADMRLGFVRKVYGILSAQLFATTLFVYIGTVSTAFQAFVAGNPWVIIVAFLGSILSLITLACFGNIVNKVPNNYIILGIFTFCEAFIVACICGFYDPVTVLIAAVMTLGMTVALTAYAMTTKKDFTTSVGIMIVFLVAAMMFAFFIPFFFHSRLTEVIVAVVFIIIYGIYLVIDTQLILGSGKYRFDEEDYIVAALNIYVDIIGLFVYLLQLLGDKR
jgi:FtsH-binding integral membrane protein